MSAAPTPNPAPARVLVVDDNGINRYMLSQHVTQLGHQVAAAANGVKALEMLQAETFDLVLLDVMMPEMDGHAVLERMKENPRWQAIPVIVVSSLDEIQSVVRCIEQGAEDFLSKPFDPVLLKARMGASLEKKRLRDQEQAKTAELEAALTKLKATQDRLLVQEKLASLGALTAGIAHEIKNPLNFVCNFAKLSGDLLNELQETLQPVQGSLPEKTREDLDDVVETLRQNIGKIAEHGHRADGIVRGMLLHSRGKAGERQLTDINALVAEQINLAYHGHRATDVSFNVTIDAVYDQTLKPAMVVPQDLSRVFLNLLNNACFAVRERQKSSGPDYVPTLTVRTKAVGDRIEVVIRDNGNGIPAAIREKIYQPFFTTKPAGAGTGLGLSLSFDIVVQGHGGEILLDTVEGQYAQFTVVLPPQPGK